ncbi:head GIN domain-containing protein [uncultured Algibacter sp.]|uniref:head GIN domain-containing protein n=1 Tax=uncultured Algibacter sp. TaxID=298659 RepID=UPI003216C645
MKHLIVIFAIFISASTFAQDALEKKVGDFSILKVYDLIHVELVKSDENKVTITGGNSNDVVINNKNGTLKIKMNLEESFDGNKTKVILYYTSIDVIDVNEGAKVTSKETIKQFEMDLKAQEGGQIDVSLDVSYTNVKSVTGGVITTTGRSKKQKINIFTGGEYLGKALETEDTEVSIKAAGEAHINATNLADIKIRVGGDVFVYGNPENVNESKVIGGRIKHIKS